MGIVVLQYPLLKMIIKGLLTRKEERILIHGLKIDGNVGVFDRLANDGIKLCVSVAKKYRGDQKLLVLHGFIGWVKALFKYDVRSRYRFCTYSTWWINNEIRRVLGLPEQK